MATAKAKAVELVAREIEAQGPAWKRAADNVRAGYRNLWLEPALKAVERALQEGPDDES